MNPLRTIKILVKANRLFGLIEAASTDYTRRQAHGDDMSKSIFVSKIFWFNLLTAAAELSQVLPLPPGTIAIAAAVINIGLRLVTDKPVHVV